MDSPTTNFPGLKIGEVWFAWTEDPEDDIANKLRKKFKDRLLRLVDANNRILWARYGRPDLFYR